MATAFVRHRYPDLLPEEFLYQTSVSLIYLGLYTMIIIIILYLCSYTVVFSGIYSIVNVMYLFSSTGVH